MPPVLPQTVLRRYRVAENRSIADGCFALMLETTDPATSVPPFQPGQWVYMHLLNPDGSTWARAAYSIANAPCTGTATIELGIKLEGDYTKRAMSLKEGDEVLLQGPWGVFTPKADRPHMALFAGGIGVTPLLCMARQMCATNAENDMTFFYSFRVPEGAAYLEELRALASGNPRLKFIPLCTGADAAWEGERGRLNASVLQRELPNGADDYLLCGSDGFMEGVRDLLIARGVDPKRIRKESFG